MIDIVSVPYGWDITLAVDRLVEQQQDALVRLDLLLNGGYEIIASNPEFMSTGDIVRMVFILHRNDIIKAQSPNRIGNI